MNLEVYFDYGSPFAYLGVSQAQRVASEAGARLVYKPILLGGLFRTLGGPMVPIASFSEPKRQHALADMHRWAEHWQVPFKYPSRFPMRTVDAMRVTLLAFERDPERAPALVADLYNRYWALDGDLADPATLGSALEACGLDPAWLQESAQAPAKQALIHATSEAAERGVFGVPTWAVGDQLFWGQDRLELVKKALGGWRVTIPA